MSDTTLSISVSNVGGIDSMSCSFKGPVGIVTGPNASNKTSLLRAVAFGLGYPNVPIRSGASEARVELTVGDETVVRTATRNGPGISVEGDALVDSENSDLLETFACLVEFNDLRSAVRHDGDYASLLKAPMNLDELERERAEKISEKNELRADVDRLDDVEERLEERREELGEARERVADLDAELDSLRERQSDVVDDDGELEDLREERASLVSERDQYREQIEDLEAAIVDFDERVEDVEADLAEAREAVEEYDVAELREERKRIERDLHDLVDRVEVLQSVVTANREMQDSDYRGALGQDAGLMGDTVTCWTCGQEADSDQMAATTEALTDIIKRDRERRQEYEPRLEDIDDRIAAAEDAEAAVEDLEARKRDLEQRRSARRESLATKHEELDRVTAAIDDLDDELAERESEQQTEATDVAEDIEETRVDLHAARREVERLEAAVEDLRDRREERQRKAKRADELADEVAALTDRIENLEDDLREEFNDAMDELIDLLDYERIERIWLDGEFDLVIAREVDGAVRQDSLDHLSESERESVGLVLALAGHLAYDVSDHVPVLLLDTLGAFDAERTKELLGYFNDKLPLVLTALLPNSAEAITTEDLPHERLEAPERIAD
jgi:predicted  nucleic acid-binding Zn-ribbon protein